MMKGYIPKNARKTTVNTIAFELRKNIILRQYHDDDNITETKLAEEFSISRGTIRAVLQLLEAEGLVKNLPNGRKKILEINERFIYDLTEIRKDFEVKAMNYLLEHDSCRYRFLKNVLPIQEKMVKYNSLKVDTEKRVALDSGFHSAIAEASENRALIQCWNVIEPTIRTIQIINATYSIGAEQLHEYLVTHKQIMELAIVGDPEAVNVLEQHLYSSRDLLLASLRKNNCI